ncbi:MAG: NTP transferase domain-containing protein [Hahellaceae bacterium]|nr:NTP transferase domain-containing protein [Hahellaceae bacterium]
MRDLGWVIAHIPARAGSKRVKAKNLRLLCGKPLLAYSIECAKRCPEFDEIYVNSDSDEMLTLAQQLGVSGYRRSESLADDLATGDQFTADFIENNKVKTLVMINPVCPLIEPEDVSRALKTFQASECDTLITCDSTRMQTFCQTKPVNISLDGQLAPTQENPEVQILNWAVTVWDAASFMTHYKNTGSAYIGKKRVLMPIDPIKGLKISLEQDFKKAECLLYGMKHVKLSEPKIEYWSLSK